MVALKTTLKTLVTKLVAVGVNCKYEQPEWSTNLELISFGESEIYAGYYIDGGFHIYLGDAALDHWQENTEAFFSDGPDLAERMADWLFRHQDLRFANRPLPTNLFLENYLSKKASS